MAHSINIKIAEKTYPLKVTSPEHEELIRKAADDINRRGVGIFANPLRTLVVHGARRIEVVQPSRDRCEVRAVAALVAHRPEDHRQEPPFHGGYRHRNL